MEKKTSKPGKKWFLITGIIVIVAAAGGLLGVPLLQAKANNAGTTYRTETLQKGSLTATVGASGNVYTRQSVALKWATSGVVSQVLVSKGQKVQKGDVLAVLDQSSLPQNVLSAASALAADQQALDDLLNSSTTRANAQLALITAQQDLQSAQKATQSAQFQRASQTTIDVTNANLIQAQDALNKAQQTYNHIKAGGTDSVQYAAALSQLANAQQKYDQAALNMQYVTSLPDPLSIQKANANLALAQAKYNDAKRAWDQVKDGPNPADVAAAEAKVAADQAILDQAKITAPIAGTVTAINTQPGDLVSAQGPAFQIDDLSALYVDISVSEVDINSVQIGQPVEITLDAIPNKTYPGKVTDIDTNGQISSGAVNFTVTAQITNSDPLIKPGMTASGNIVVTHLSDVLVVPSSAIRTVGAQQVVYILQNGTPTPLPVTTGATSDTSVEVTGGLQVGDVIVLNPPSTPTTAGANRGVFGGLFGGLFGGRGGAEIQGGNFNGGNFNNRTNSNTRNNSAGGNSGNNVNPAP